MKKMGGVEAFAKENANASANVSRNNRSIKREIESASSYLEKLNIFKSFTRK